MSRDVHDVYDEYREDPNLKHLQEKGRLLVPGIGSERPYIFIVGRAPTATENDKRQALKGREGRVIKELIEWHARLGDTWWYTFIVKYHLTGNRTPTRQELVDSLPHLRSENQALGGPGVIVTVGGNPLGAMFPGIRRPNVGQPNYGGLKAVVWPMIHPAQGLAVPSMRKSIEQHWENLGNWARAGGII